MHATPLLAQDAPSAASRGDVGSPFVKGSEGKRSSSRVTRDVTRCATRARALSSVALSEADMLAPLSFWWRSEADRPRRCDCVPESDILPVLRIDAPIVAASTTGERARRQRSGGVGAEPRRRGGGGGGAARGDRRARAHTPSSRGQTATTPNPMSETDVAVVDAVVAASWREDKGKGRDRRRRPSRTEPPRLAGARRGESRSIGRNGNASSAIRGRGPDAANETTNRSADRAPWAPTACGEAGDP